MGERGSEKASVENMTQEGRAAGRKKLREKSAEDLKQREMGNQKGGRDQESWQPDRRGKEQRLQERFRKAAIKDIKRWSAC